MEELSQTQGNGYISIITGNHDTERISYSLTESELRLAYAFVLTLHGAPFFYYGDEIAMRYIPQKSKEGGYHRTGARTPMQWDKNQPNLGFSTAEQRKLYLDVDRADDAPCAKQQMEEPNSLWTLVRALNQLRLSHVELQSDAKLKVLVCSDDGVLCYQRGSSIGVAFNPTDEQRTLALPIGSKLFEIGKATADGSNTILAPQTAVVFQLADK